MNKQTQFKSILTLLFVILLSVLIYATAGQDIPDSTDVILNSPANNAYNLNTSVYYNCSGEAVMDWNITYIKLYTNANGTWRANQTFNFTVSSTNNTYVSNVFIQNVTDGLDIIWNCMTNYTNFTDGGQGINKLLFSTNRTVNVEVPPNVTLTSPPNNYWTNGSSERINYSVWSLWTTENFNCYLYSNTSTSNWTRSTYDRGINESDKNKATSQFTHLFEEGRWNYGIWCAEGSDTNIYAYSNNFTINVDRTAPVPNITHIDNVTAVNNNYFRKYDIYLNYSVIEVNPLNCSVSINGTGNVSDDSKTTKSNFTISFGTDGVYSALVQCFDMTNMTGNSTSYLFTIDRNVPSIGTVQNGTPSGYYDRWAINWTSDEIVNYTIWYGTTVNTGSNISTSVKTLNSSGATLTGLLENRAYYYNITVCDVAGNCNVSSSNNGNANGQHNFTFPYAIRTGWSLFGIYESRINFSRIFTQTETEYAYYYNQTSQTWVYATNGGSTNQNFELGNSIEDAATQGRHIVFLYESVNSTWDNRNISNTSYYKYNFTTGSNFIKISNVSMTIGDIAVSLFSNHTSCKYGSELCYTPDSVSWLSNLTYNMTQFYFSGFNNSANTWTINYIYNWTENNRTYLNRSSVSEAAWIYSPVNLSWNGSNIYVNWTGVV